MSEKIGNPNKNRFETLERFSETLEVAQNPVEYLRGMKNKECSVADAIGDLLKIRRRIRQGFPGVYVLPKIPEEFAVFCNQSDSDNVHFYEALFSMLKQSGFSEVEVREYFMDTTIFPNPGAIRDISAHIQKAAENVYRKE